MRVSVRFHVKWRFQPLARREPPKSALRLTRDDHCLRAVLVLTLLGDSENAI